MVNKRLKVCKAVTMICLGEEKSCHYHSLLFG